ncbi:MAG: MFS transporter [Desulfobacteraceae bacterium]|nr:MAG: MFS transporter [Desulfobacteraceae bacterium]
MIVALIMGFASGLPLLLTLSVLQAWMKEEGVDLTVIGLMTLVGLPYTLKFLWAPVLDRFTLPFLGRRLGWLLVAQLFLMLSIVLLAFTNPGKQPWLVAFAAFWVTFFSASQDITIDAYRREDLPDEELGLGSSFYVNGYRVGMLLASGGGLIMADHIPFRAVYLIMALCMLPGVITTILTPEPDNPAGTPGSIREAVFDPLLEYFSRTGAIWILSFVLFYKIGDAMASAMTTPFYLDIGFTKTQIGAVVKLFGFWATIAGSLVGGVMMLKIGIYSSLWVFGVLQAVSTACFALLAHIGPSVAGLSAVIAFENLSSGMGTTAYVAFMASITNKRFTATQYALLSSLMGIPRVFASAPTGFFAKQMGWEWFFIFCAVVAFPGMMLLLKFTPGAHNNQQ